MTAYLLITEAILVALFALYINFYYGNWRKQHKMVSIISCLSWYLPILILFIIPIDISVAYYNKCFMEFQQENKSHKNQLDKCTVPWLLIDSKALLVFWHLAYWTTFCLTWICLPIIQSYAKSGSFTILGKLKSSLIDNAIYYGTYLLVVIIIGIYLIIKHTIPINLSSIKLLVITASNTWGMFLVVLFLGYGLVEFPRDLWSRGDIKNALHHAYAQLPMLHIERVEEEEELDILIRKGKQWSNQMPSNHKYRHFMDIILDKIEEAEGDMIQLSEESSLRFRDNSSYNSTAQSSYYDLKASKELGDCQFTMNDDSSSFKQQLKSLEKLHRAIKIRMHRFLRAHALWEDTVQRAIELEDVEANKVSGIRYYRQSTHLSASSIPQSTLSRIKSRLTWYWLCYFNPFLLRGFALLAMTLSILLVWSECTFWVKHPVLSVFARLVQLSAAYYNYFTVAMVSFMSIGYLSLCVYFTVFRLKIFNYFRLVPNHHSDENSLIFCGMLLCRLTPPLCLNFLGLVHLDSHILVSPATNPTPTTLSSTTTHNSSTISVNKQFVETAYTRFMGHLDLIPLIARGFNIYFPLLVLVLCLFTLLRLGERIMTFLGLQLLFGDEEFGDKIRSIEEGRLLLKKERQRHSRYGLSSNVEKKKPDYRSTVIELSNRNNTKSPDKQRLLDNEEMSNSDWAAPVEYNEAMIANDYRLSGFVSSSNQSQPSNRVSGHSSNSNTNNNINSKKTFNNPASALFKRFWPI